MPYTCFVLKTVAETEVFQRYAAQIWSNSELAGFIDWIAANPLAGDVIPGAGGCRKVRWSRSGMGKRGGVRVIYFNSVDGRIWLLIAYTKAKFDNLSADFLAKLKAEVMNHG
ncbi:MAG: transcriptional regulator [Pseudomonadota bacterium]|nr:transcriptional regulator [Pseudomonadota bacterium]